MKTGKHHQSAHPQQFVAVLDFGAQYAQLIARRVRDLHVYSEILPADITAKELRNLNPSAIILSGGPASVYAEDAPTLDPEILHLGIPVFGFCYGEQIMAQTLGGHVAHAEKGEYGPATLTRSGDSILLEGTSKEGQTVWMSHRDYVDQAPEGFAVTASTEHAPLAVIENTEKNLYATQFHPEVAHTQYGQQMLSNFLFNIAHLDPTWTMDNIVQTKVDEIRAQAGESKVILGLSGGVDSAVAAALVHRAIGDQLTCVFVNHGFLRKGEPEHVEHVFREVFGIPLVVVNAQERYLELLHGVTDPEEKRSIIGTEFWRIFFEEAKKLGDVRFLAQGTIYPDIIESGSRKTGKETSTIKSHHNLIPFPEGVHFDLVEPLDHFFKDEVRALGLALGLPESVVFRQPFPGPGLAIRIIGEITKEKLDLLKDADAIVREELDAYNTHLAEKTGARDGFLENDEPGAPAVAYPVWQYFAVLPGSKSVGVMGDERTYGEVIVVRAVESSDAMTADWAKLPYKVLSGISRRIVGEVPGVNRVVYDITSKPPATIEWE